MTRVAQCQCGALRVEADGEHEVVVACSCNACQRRTGAVFGVVAYFPRDQVRVAGEAREFLRHGESGHGFRSYFCPTCGSSVYVSAERDPDRIGIAVGAFADPSFPAPQRSVYEVSKHPWVDFGADVPGFEKGRAGPRSR